MLWNRMQERISNAMEAIGNRPPEDHLDRDRTPLVVWNAGKVLKDEVSRLEKENERLRIQATVALAREQKPLMEGYPLVPGWDGGGFRHFLAGERVPNGTGLRLLTAIGWLPGRYESRSSTDGRFEREAWLHFYLPGHDWDVAIPLGPEARLAWPSAFGEPERY